MVFFVTQRKVLPQIVRHALHHRLRFPKTKEFLGVLGALVVN